MLSCTGKRSSRSPSSCSRSLPTSRRCCGPGLALVHGITLWRVWPASAAVAARRSTRSSTGPSTTLVGKYCSEEGVMHADLCFPVGGELLPTDHLYALLAALSRVVRAFHEPGGPRFTAINGDRGPSGHIRLFEKSRGFGKR